MPSEYVAKVQLRMWLNLWGSWEEKETYNLKHEEQIQHQTSEASREQDIKKKKKLDQEIL